MEIIEISSQPEKYIFKRKKFQEIFKELTREYSPKKYSEVQEIYIVPGSRVPGSRKYSTNSRIYTVPGNQVSVIEKIQHNQKIFEEFPENKFQLMFKKLQEI